MLNNSKEWEKETLEDSRKNRDNAIDSLEKAKKLFQKGFQNKTRKKECLSIISEAFDYMHFSLFSEILVKLNNEVNPELEKLSWDIPSYPSQLTDNKIKKWGSYSYYLTPLMTIKKLYTEVKDAEVTGVKLTPLERKAKQYSDKLKVQDRSQITNEKEYNKAIQEIVNSADKIISPFYIEEIKRRIKLKHMDFDDIVKLEKSASNLYLDYLRYKTDEEIKKDLLDLKKLLLLDIEYRAKEKINFDIESIELLDFNNRIKRWKLNNDKLFEIEVIPAGGYNIQKFHTRVLTKLKKLKK